MEICHFGYGRELKTWSSTMYYIECFSRHFQAHQRISQYGVQRVGMFFILKVNSRLYTGYITPTQCPRAMHNSTNMKEMFNHVYLLAFDSNSRTQEPIFSMFSAKVVSFSFRFSSTFSKACRHVLISSS